MEISAATTWADRSQIVLPYAISDTFPNFATIKAAELMQALSG
jgi:hypothetical protein